MIRYMGQILVDTKVSRDGSKDGVPFVCLLNAMRCDAMRRECSTRRDGGGCLCVYTDNRILVGVRSFVRSPYGRRTTRRVESIDVCVKLNRRLRVGRPTDEED